MTRIGLLMFYFAGIIACFLATHVAVHCLGLMLAVPFYMMKKRMDSLLRTIDRSACLLAEHYCPLVPLCNGEQISSWLALFRFEKLVMKLKFSESSLPLGVLLFLIFLQGIILLVNALTKSNVAVMATFASYLVMSTMFFISAFALAAMITSTHEDLPLKVREQKVVYVFHGDACSGAPAADEVSVGIEEAAEVSLDQIPRDDNISDQLDEMIGYLETNSDVLKLLKVVPANFVVLNLIAGYAVTMIISVMSYVGAYYSTIKAS
jgi:hypothetical protein